MSDTAFEITRHLEETIDNALPDDVLKPFEQRLNELAEEATRASYDYFKENIGYWFAEDVRQTVNTIIEYLLKGNTNVVNQYLKLEGYNGRSDGAYSQEKELERQHPIIHGKLHENHCLEIRRRIAEANERVITNERVKDLEDQLASVIAQNTQLEKEIEHLRDRLRR